MTADELKSYKLFLKNLSDTQKKERDLYLRALSLGEVNGNLTGYASVDKPWLKWFEPEKMNQPLKEMSAYDYFVNSTSKFPEKTILLDYYGRQYTSKDIQSEVERLANMLTNMGVREGDIVSFLMLNVPEAIFLWYALNSIGAVANMIKFDESPERIKYMTEITKSKYLFVSSVPFIIKNVKEALQNNQSLNKVITVELTESLPFPLQARMLFEQCQMNREIKETINSSKKQTVGEKIKDAKAQLKELKKSKSEIDDIVKGDNNFVTYKECVEKFKKPIKNKTKLENVGNKTSIIVYTGGTTGQAKGVEITNNNLNAMSAAIHYGDTTYSLGNTALNILPPSITYYYNAIHGNMPNGVKVYSVAHFTIEEYPYLVKKYRPNIFQAGPILLNQIRKVDNIKDPSFMKAPVSGGDKLFEEEEIAWNKKYPLVHQGWGMSESTACAAYAKTNCYKLGSVGVPLINLSVAIFEYGTDNELTYGEAGEICISGPTLMKGYYANEEATNKVMKIHSDGTKWLHTGDYGYMDNEGRLWYKGRDKRMITRSGNKVWLSDIEDYVSKMPEVEQCSCVKLMDDEEREVPIIHIVLKDNSIDVNNLVNNITNGIQANLNPYNIPKYFIIRAELPYSEVNKKCDIKALESENIFDSLEYTNDGMIFYKKQGLKLKRDR